MAVDYSNSSIYKGVFINNARYKSSSAIYISNNFNAFKSFMVVDTSKDIINIPTFAQNKINNFLSDKQQYNYTNDYVAIDLTPKNALGIKTPSSTLKFFKTILSDSRYYDTEEFKYDNETYYGVNGLLLDKNFNIIMYTSTEYQNTGYITTSSTTLRHEISYSKLQYKGIRNLLNVDKSVFISNSKINNYIRNTVIPTFCNQSAFYGKDYTTAWIDIVSDNTIPFNVNIDSLSDLTTKSFMPYIKNDISKDIHNILVNEFDYNDFI